MENHVKLWCSTRDSDFNFRRVRGGEGGGGGGTIRGKLPNNLSVTLHEMLLHLGGKV